MYVCMHKKMKTTTSLPRQPHHHHRNIHSPIEESNTKKTTKMCVFEKERERGGNERAGSN